MGCCQRSTLPTLGRSTLHHGYLLAGRRWSRSLNFTLRSRLRHEGEPVRGSRFITTASPVDSEEIAKQLLVEVKAEMPDASHHCWAWRISRPAVDRASDDGEPGGSAGRPILAQMVGRDLVDTAVIVTRYFGGTKLGVGGLVRAYGGAAGAALDLASLTVHQHLVELVVMHGYADERVVLDAVAQASGMTREVIHQQDVHRVVSVPEPGAAAFIQSVLDVTAGRAVVEDP